MDSGRPKESCIRWGSDPHALKGNFEAEKCSAETCPAVDYSKRVSRAQHWYDADASRGVHNLANMTEPSV